MDFGILEHLFSFFYNFNIVDPAWVVGALTTVVTAMAIFLIPRLIFSLIGWFI